MDDYDKILDNFSLIFISKEGNEKIILKLDDKNTHYTLHFGTKSKVLDIHKTIELPDNQKSYETLIKINHFTLGRLLVVLNNIIPLIETIFFSNKVNPSFLRRHKIFAQSMDDKDLNDVKIMKFNEKKLKLKFEKEPDFNSLENLFIDIDKEMKAAPYMLWKYKSGNMKNVGLLFVVYNTEGKKQFYFITKKMYNNFIKGVFTKVIQALENNANAEGSLYTELSSMYKNKYMNVLPSKKDNGILNSTNY